MSSDLVERLRDLHTSGMAGAAHAAVLEAADEIERLRDELGRTPDGQVKAEQDNRE